MEEVLAHADVEDDPVSKSEEVGADQLDDDHTTQARGRKSYTIGLKLASLTSLRAMLHELRGSWEFHDNAYKPGKLTSFITVALC